MAELKQVDSHAMGLHDEQLVGRTQQMFFSAEEAENFTYPGSFDVRPSNTDRLNSVTLDDPQNMLHSQLLVSLSHPTGYFSRNEKGLRVCASTGPTRTITPAMNEIVATNDESVEQKSNACCLRRRCVNPTLCRFQASLRTSKLRTFSWNLAWCKFIVPAAPGQM